eukprot:CAMPEP_0118665832 /NCGR_PEP_ID=MMETSP0785-20121206/18855_1 /TAXON_ID=91992 /ORGANISM="Bolidomonas pacifica, Strain CCMP 1866" /LENGTH=401 /DNA_ID=CAMNT_0006560029 /DNA_START=153 /DNA_END=1355 /DNA_ORIENTATION=-
MPSNDDGDSEKKRSKSIWNRMKKRVKETGWVKRWDANYQHDYWENTIEGRVTWTDHTEDTRPTTVSGASDAGLGRPTGELTTTNPGFARQGTLGDGLESIENAPSESSIGSGDSFESGVSFQVGGGREKKKKKKKKKGIKFASGGSDLSDASDCSTVTFRESVDIEGHQKISSPNLKKSKGRKGTQANIGSKKLEQLQLQAQRKMPALPDDISALSEDSFEVDREDKTRNPSNTLANQSSVEAQITLGTGLDDRKTNSGGFETTNPMAENYVDENSRKFRLRRMTAAMGRKLRASTYWYQDPDEKAGGDVEMKDVVLEEMDENERRRIKRQRKKEKEYRRRKKRDEARRNNRAFTIGNHMEDAIVDRLSDVKYKVQDSWSNAKKSKVYTLRFIFALIFFSA